MLLVLTCTLVGGCGGGGLSTPDPLAPLEGSWFGRSLPGSPGTIGLVIDGAGQITQFEKDGILTPATGFLTHVSGRYYEGELPGDDIRFFVDPSGKYAVFFTEFMLAAVERDATELPPGPLQLSTVAPGEYAGTNLQLDANAAVVAESATTVSVAAIGTYVGSDARGFLFGSTPGNPLAAATNFFGGGYEDSVNLGQGFIELIPSPDGLFHAVASFPQANTTLVNAAFIGAWNRQ